MSQRPWPPLVVRCALMEPTGRAQAVNVVSPVHRWWTLWLKFSWPPADRMAWVKRPLCKLAFIHVAHWALVEEISGDGAGRPSRPLPYPYLIFHSNYNDDLAAYIDAFALIVPWRMRLMWHGIYDFPGPRIVDSFLEFVDRRKIPSAHYWCAYPEGSARTIDAALKLADRNRELVDEASTLTDQQFAARFEQFVTDNQLLL
jgi:hypothetical protein